MSTEFTHCKTYRTSDRKKILSVLEQNPLKISISSFIMIGSRAARQYLPNFRGISGDKNADRDIIISSNILLDWLRENKKKIRTTDMIMPLSNDDEQLDLYIYCTYHDESKYDFSVPRSSTSYTAYILSNPYRWIVTNIHHRRNFIASAKLLLIFKKYMLYYSHQWEKTAKDFYELLGIADPLDTNDMELCNLFIRYNEKLHGRRPLDFNEFVINSTNTQKGITIHRNEFIHDVKEK